MRTKKEKKEFLINSITTAIADTLSKHAIEKGCKMAIAYGFGFITALEYIEYIEQEYDKIKK